MFFRLLLESFRRQRRRKLLAGAAILLGITAVTTMLALATTIGDRIHQELAVYGANIIVYPKADTLDVSVGGINLKPNTGNAYLKETDLTKLKSIFWANNITGISPELSLNIHLAQTNLTIFGHETPTRTVAARGLWFNHEFGSAASSITTGAIQLHPYWKVTGRWPKDRLAGPREIVLGTSLAKSLNARIGSELFTPDGALMDPDGRGLFNTSLFVTGIVEGDEQIANEILLPLASSQGLLSNEITGDNLSKESEDSDISKIATPIEDPISRIEISARTKPEDAFARQNPDTLSPQQKEIWYCRPYANSIAYQIQEAIPNSHAEQIRKVEQSEGNVLNRISGLMWLIAAAALLAASFAVSAAMATAVLERRAEIGLMRSLGASRPAIALLFYAETAILAIGFGTIGYLTGSALAATLGHRIFPTGAPEPTFNIALLPAVLALALIVAIAGSTPSIRNALRQDPSAILRNGA